ncbi:AAA domain protein [Gregarina niphandrodes]|uniref:AAA domain protein n=1 Tax=Gregarina niphandrodes TaxID=110365 RepID=A0A023B1A7_GRENI|nr:AAA domain protein [Gregarina niphandrodes]EZG46958.1 AAA domain protein [Gregarina niphandrodes]|eukprot:XP_011132233.1 AAA domain protein [Gregarina niphandrodes]
MYCSDIVDDRDSDVDYERLLLQRAMSAPKGSQAVAETRERFANFDILELKDHYLGEDDYINHYYPLYLIEAKQAIYRAREMEMSAQSGEIVTQHSVMLKHEDTFEVVIERHSIGASMGIGDLVLLYKDGPAPNHFSTRAAFLEQVKDGNIAFLESADPSRLVNDNEEESPATTPGPGSNAPGAGTGGAGTGGAGTGGAGTGGGLGEKNNLPAVDGDGNALRACSPLEDNPHHALGVIDSMGRGLVTIRILVRESSLTPADFKITVPSKDSNEKRQATVDFMFRRETYRMHWLVEQLTNRSDPTWYLAKVMNLTTIFREYQALMALPDVLLRNYLLQTAAGSAPKDGKQLERWKRRREAEERSEKFQIPQQLRNTLDRLYNASQMAALEDCLKSMGITCIQGPPGTGKTTTIMGILSVILNAQKTKEDTEKDKSLLDVSAEPSPINSDDEAENTPSRRIARCNLPWLKAPSHCISWQDEQDFSLEDIADPTPVPNAIQEREYIDVIRSAVSEPPKRILVCAPSNAAIDEIVRRLTRDPKQGGGIYDTNGERHTPQVLRVGPNCHSDLTNWSLRERVRRRMELEGKGGQNEEALKLALLAESRVVCCTLSVAGARELTSFHEGFDTVVVDEASQGVELSTLVPLKLNAKRLILVGDPRQLPATVFSKVAGDLHYDQSLFQRLEKAGHKINMLSVQYRMHPRISEFPSQAYYDGNLADWEGVEAACKPPIPYYHVPIFKPVVFFSLDSQESSQSSSKVNMDEVDFIIQMIDLLKILFSGVPEYNWMERIAVISPYAEQVKTLIKQIKALMGVDKQQPCPIDVNTVDGFQGREKDLVLFSAVRAQYIGDSGILPNKANVGFLADVRRMNVALTRARLNLWVVGNGRYLSKNPEWGKFVQHCNNKNAMFNVNHVKYSKSGFLKHWLTAYLERVPEAAEPFLNAVPDFLERIKTDSKLLLEAERAAAAALASQQAREEELAS